MLVPKASSAIQADGSDRRYQPTGRSGRLVMAATLGLCATLLPVTHAHADDHGRPMEGSCTTTFQFTAVPDVLDVHVTCNFRHLGATTGTASQTVTQQANGRLLITNDGIAKAESGDLLYSNFVGIGVLTFTPGIAAPTGVSFSGTETYRGGTGRFSDALGSSAIAGSASFATGKGEFATRGTIWF